MSKLDKGVAATSAVPLASTSSPGSDSSVLLSEYAQMGIECRKGRVHGHLAARCGQRPHTVQQRGKNELSCLPFKSLWMITSASGTIQWTVSKSIRFRSFLFHKLGECLLS